MCRRPGGSKGKTSRVSQADISVHLIPTVERTVHALSARIQPLIYFQVHNTSREATHELTSIPMHTLSRGNTDVRKMPIDERQQEVERRGECSVQGYEAQRKPQRKRSRHSPDDPGLTAKKYKRHFVKHEYHDHAKDPLLVETSTEDDTRQTTARGGVITPFPIVLHSMLGGVEEVGLSHIVSWQAHGRAFAVHDPEAFVKTVMLRYFRQSKMSSFQRQLNLYGFARLTNAGADKGAYYHEYFLKGREDLCVKMTRTRIKGTGVRTSSSPETEPNFYTMSPVRSTTPPSTTETSDALDHALPARNNLLQYGFELVAPMPTPLPPPYDRASLSMIHMPITTTESAGRTSPLNSLFHIRAEEQQHPNWMPYLNDAQISLKSFEPDMKVSASPDLELALFLSDTDLV